jgi:hypothetical protein
MTRETLIEILEKLLRADAQLGFLQQLSEAELQTLVACVRARVDQEG